MRRAVSALLFAAALLSPLPALAGWAEGSAAYDHKDWPVAARELGPLADRGDLRAESRLGHMLMDGLGVPKDQAKGLALIKAAAAGNDPEGEFWLALFLQTGRAGMPRDPGAAVTLLERAAAQHHPAAINNLAVVYLAGLGVPRDVPKAIGLLHAAAADGQASAADNLARLYWMGGMVRKDHPQAVRWLRQAAQGGMAWSQNVLGLALFNGDSVAQDQAQGVAWFRRAAERGLPDAQFNLGEAYASGRGVAADPVQAYAWLAAAAATAPPASKARFQRARDQMAARLQPADQDRARRLAAAIAAHRPPPPHVIAGTRALAGSGFFVSRRGLVLTNNHVVPACRAIRVTPWTTATTVPATVVARDTANDLALLSTGVKPAAVAQFRDGPPMRAGDEVVVVGYPLSSLLSREPNVTDGVVSALAGAHGDRRFLQITAPVQKGNSGGPLADMSGDVVGVVSLKLNAMVVEKVYDDMPENVNFALKASYAQRFLAAHGVAPRAALPGRALSAADVGARLKQAAAFVECQQ